MAEDVLRLQLRHGLDTEAVNVAERAAGSLHGAREVTVCFADLVDFTRLGEAVPPEEPENLANRLTCLARDVAAPPVRFIKTIGDAVMFVSTDAAALLRAALGLVAAAEKDDLPQLRVGLAAGKAVGRAGDWFGSPVNLASRVTAMARPGAVLVAESAHDAIGDTDDFAWPLEICQTTGIDLEFLQRIHCAVGLPRIDAPSMRQTCCRRWRGRSPCSNA